MTTRTTTWLLCRRRLFLYDPCHCDKFAPLGAANETVNGAEEEADKLDRSIAKRRWIYEHDLYAKHIASNAYTLYQSYPTPAQFAASPDLMSRTTMFLRRCSAEVYAYARSPYKDLFVYDSVAQYEVPTDVPVLAEEPRRRWGESSCSRSPQGLPRDAPAEVPRRVRSRSRSRSSSNSRSGRRRTTSQERRLDHHPIHRAVLDNNCVTQADTAGVINVSKVAGISMQEPEGHQYTPGLNTRCLTPPPLPRKTRKL
ncbi:hypothetical protein DFH06DRAFT_1215564 [Mycena polygramma]|nr:hypothetical protein DFH06DRAFT_1215564 [Mycena polygramma]